MFDPRHRATDRTRFTLIFVVRQMQVNSLALPHLSGLHIQGPTTVLQIYDQGVVLGGSWKPLTWITRGLCSL